MLGQREEEHETVYPDFVRDSLTECLPEKTLTI
jgi:hypothetical protein